MRNNLAILSINAGAYREAESAYRDLLALRRTRQGEHSAVVAGTYQNLAVAVAGQGRYGEADSLARRAEVIFREVEPPGSIVVAFPMLTRAEILLSSDDPGAAARVATEAGRLLRGRVPVSHPAAIMADCRLGRARARLGDTAAARVLLDSVARRLATAEGVRPNHRRECIEARARLDEEPGG